ncbi:unnamed protein product [Cladocopium goreaui]|uniref:Transmembrane protein n=1 Tax=Cladocopium goreaui TaxID=2562237 RepID=A0A9P1CSV3_9DINO|nr:unnamed protein product [Cladocopium goreaui]
MARYRLFYGLLLFCVSLAGWLSTSLCSFECWALFAAITVLLLMWCLARAPLLCISFCYLANCGVLLVRETFLIFTGWVPCGLVTFGDECAETQCVKKNYVFFFEAGCGKYACVRTERHEVQSVFRVPTESLHTFWLLTGLCLCWAATLLSGRLLLRWMAESKERNLKIGQYTAIVLLLPPTYGICACSALRVITTNREDTWTAESMMDISELFSAVALYAFQRLLVVHVMSLGIKQYVVLAFSCNFILVAVKGWDWLQPSSCKTALDFIARSGFPHHNISLAVNEQKLNHSLHTRASSLACEDVWNSTSLMMMVADFFTCSIALFAVLQYERAFNMVLHPVNPFWKFWGVKGLLSVNFLQSTVLALVSWMTANDATGFVATLLNYHLLCAESFALALLNLWAYSLQDEDEKASDVNGEDVEGTQTSIDPSPEVMGKMLDA